MSFLQSFFGLSKAQVEQHVKEQFPELVALRDALETERSLRTSLESELLRERVDRERATRNYQEMNFQRQRLDDQIAKERREFDEYKAKVRSTLKQIKKLIEGIDTPEKEDC